MSLCRAMSGPDYMHQPQMKKSRKSKNPQKMRTAFPPTVYKGLSTAPVPGFYTGYFGMAR